MKARGPLAYYALALARNLLAGARLALFLPLSPAAYRVSPGHFAVLVAFNFALRVLVEGARAGFEGEIDLEALVSALGTVSLVLFAALLVAKAYRAPERLLLMATALMASEALFELGALALSYLEDARLAAILPSVWFAWLLAVAVRAVIVCNGLERPALYQGAFAVSGLMLVALVVFPPSALWREPLPEDPEPALADERVFHLQATLIERALAAVSRGAPGEPELYFVGFAPDASQDVFLRELRSVRQLFDERFATAGRSIALASSQDALGELPIASATNLSRALARAGEAMNIEEDLLFLYITAHGDRDHRLSAWQPPLALTPLTPVFLARMLRDSGIRWRVIVVSACFSGGYVDALRDPHTMVITAAAADRHSFGCEHGSDFTYFGRALSAALAQTRSFTRAFELARQSVAAQEAAEGLEPSQPQMWIGEALAARLKALGLDEPPEQPDKK